MRAATFVISQVALADSEGLRFRLKCKRFFSQYISLGNIYLPVLQSFITCFFLLLFLFLVYSLHYVLSGFSMAGISFGIG